MTTELDELKDGTKEDAELAQFEARKFTISYDLPITADHTIDAKTLGKSLVNMAELIEDGDKLLNGEHSTVKVNVKANKEGSFAVEFVAWLQSGGVDVLRTLGIVAASTTAASATLFNVLKTLKDRRIVASIVKHNSDGQSQTYLLLEDGNEVLCDDNVKSLLLSHSIRTKLANVIQKPTSGQSDAKVVLVDEAFPEQPIVLESEDIDLFKAPSKKTYEEIKITTDTVNLVFVQLNNTSRNGWKAKLLDDEFAVKMDDESFLARINSKQDFPVKDELFEVLLETTKRIYDGKTTYSYRITEVKRHRTTADRKIL